MNRRLIFLSATVLLLSACQWTTPGTSSTQDATNEDHDSMMDDDHMMDDDAMMDDEGDSMMDDDHMMEADTHASYTAYTPGILTNGEPKVLFFHAAWCPNCRQADEQLARIYSEANAMLSVYRIDYDTEAELKQRYGITYQHTFVVVDGEGNAIQTVQGPTEAQLRAMVGA